MVKLIHKKDETTMFIVTFCDIDLATSSTTDEVMYHRKNQHTLYQKLIVSSRDDCNLNCELGTKSGSTWRSAKPVAHLPTALKHQ